MDRAKLIVLVVALLVALPLFLGPGPVNTRGGGDSPFLIFRLHQLVANLRAGVFPVRWMPDAAYGLGYPFFNFYAALPYYLAALFYFLSGRYIFALQVTQALGFVGAALGMYGFARRVFRGKGAAALAAIAYTCAPFHLVNVYTRGDSLAEFYAFVFYPLIFWSLLRLREHPTPARTALLSLSYGGLILTHNISALIFSPFVVIYALFLLLKPEGGTEADLLKESETRSEVLSCMIIGLALGLALSTWFWVPALGEQYAVYLGTQDIQTSGYFHYSNHFRGADLVQPRLLFNYRADSPPTPFAMGLIQAALTLLGTLCIIVLTIRSTKHETRNTKHKTQNAHLLCTIRHSPLVWLAFLLLSTLMITPLSRPLWDHLPLLPLVQFPWRFLSVQAFAAAMVIAHLAPVGEGEKARDSLSPCPLVSLSPHLRVSLSPHLRVPLSPHHLVPVIAGILLAVAALGALRPEYLPIGEEDITRENLLLYEGFTANVGTTIRGEYLPRQMQPRPFASAVWPGSQQQDGEKPRPLALMGEIGDVALLERGPTWERWQVEVVSPEAEVAFFIAYFPGWRATVDGQKAEVRALQGLGIVEVSLPEGSHEVVLHLEHTPLRGGAEVVSLVAVLVVIIMLQAGGLEGWKVGGLKVVVVLGMIIVVGLGGRWWPERDFPANDMTMDFVRMPYLHHNPDGVGFGGEIQLLDYDLPTEVRAGEVLSFTLRWQPPHPDLWADACLVMMGDQRPENDPPPLGCSAFPEIYYRTYHYIPVPDDAVPGLYLVRLRVWDGERELQPHTAQGRPLGVIYLRPVWVHNYRPLSGQEPVRGDFGAGLALSSVFVVPEEDAWKITLDWLVGERVRANYKLSLRLLAQDGSHLAQRDLQPGYGFLPTSAWPPGQLLTDRLRVPFPPDIEPADAAALEVVLYEPGRPPIGSAVIPLRERERVFTPPSMEVFVNADFGGQMRLLGYDLAREADTLTLTLHWQAQTLMPQDYKVFVHLFDPATETIVAQNDAMPLNNTYPTRWWVMNEVVSDPVVLSLADVPPGRYRLAVGVYEPQTGQRLPVTDAAGHPQPDNRLVLDEIIEIAE